MTNADCQSDPRLFPTERTAPLGAGGFPSLVLVGQPNLHGHVGVAALESLKQGKSGAQLGLGGVAVALFHQVLGDTILYQSAGPVEVAEDNGLFGARWRHHFDRSFYNLGYFNWSVNDLFDNLGYLDRLFDDLGHLNRDLHDLGDFNRTVNHLLDHLGHFADLRLRLSGRASNQGEHRHQGHCDDG